MNGKNNKKVLCFGTFDLFHPGHVSFLRQARKYGNYLVVVVARDENVKKIKGKYPLDNELKRIENLKKSKLGDNVILGKEKFSYSIIKEIDPDIICLGYDQKVDEKKLQSELRSKKEYSGVKKVYNKKIVRLLPYKENIYKSSKLNKRKNRKF